jgi:hypothetical protein
LSIPENTIVYEDFELYLIRIDQYKINQFKKYPIEYIKNLNKSVYDKFIERYPPVEIIEE